MEMIRRPVYLIRRTFLGLMLSSLTLGCSPSSETKVGSKKRPFTMYFIPSVDTQKLATSADTLVRYVEKRLSQKFYGKDEGFYVKSAIPTSYIAVVETFGTGRADFAAFNTFSYILAKDVKKYPVEAFLTVVHGNGETKYKGQIIARRDSGIKSLEDLKGKKFAYTDPASTSGYILPRQLFKQKGIELGETVFAQKHDNVVTMVYQKQVDAGATYYSDPITVEQEGRSVKEIQDARARVKTQFPDVENVVNIVGFTPEIPNEPWVIRQNVYKDVQENQKLRQHLQEALIDFSKSEEGKTMLAENYNVYGLIPTQDSTYDDIRKIVLATEVNLEELAAPKDRLKKN